MRLWQNHDYYLPPSIRERVLESSRISVQFALIGEDITSFVMKIVEYRIIVPLSLEQCRIGCAYMCAQYQTDISQAGQGYEVLANRMNSDGNQFTHKAMHFIGRAHPAIRWAIPAKWCVIHEESTDKFPSYHSEYYSAQIDRKTAGEVTDTMHVPYRKGEDLPENMFSLSPDELKKREIVYIDILNGPPSEGDLDLHAFSCPEAGVEMLKAQRKGNEKQMPEWVANYNGEMTLIVKVARMWFNWWGLQNLVEGFCINSVYSPAYRDGHRYMVKHVREWHMLREEDIREVEHQCEDRLKAASFQEDWEDKNVEQPPNVVR